MTFFASSSISERKSAVNKSNWAYLSAQMNYLTWILVHHKTLVSPELAERSACLCYRNIGIKSKHYSRAVVAHAFNPSIREAEAGGRSPSPGSAWSTVQAPGQKHRETIRKNKTKINQRHHTWSLMVSFLLYGVWSWLRCCWVDAGPWKENTLGMNLAFYSCRVVVVCVCV